MEEIRYIYFLLWIIKPFLVTILVLNILQYDGITGASPFLLHEPFHPVDGHVVDYMHSVLLGVTKQFLELWLGKESKGQDYYIGDKVRKCN